MLLTCFSMFCVLHVLCVVSCGGDAASWCLTPSHVLYLVGGVSLCSPLLDLVEVRRNCFCSMESFWASRCVNVVACPVLACRGVCRPTSVPITWLCSLWKYTAMACGTQVHCTSKKMSVVMLRSFSVLVMPAACWGASLYLWRVEAPDSATCSWITMWCSSCVTSAEGLVSSAMHVSVVTHYTVCLTMCRRGPSVLDHKRELGKNLLLEGGLKKKPTSPSLGSAGDNALMICSTELAPAHTF